MIFLLIMTIFVLSGKLDTKQDLITGFMLLGFLEILVEFAALSRHFNL